LMHVAPVMIGVQDVELGVEVGKLVIGRVDQAVQTRSMGHG
jgi:hypothetical protein